MKLIRVSLIILISAFVFAAIGCAKDEGRNDANSQAGKEIQKDDGSTVAVSTAADGTKTEVRTFKGGEVARVTRTTSPSGRRTANVEMRDGRKADLDDEGDIEKAMDATGDFIATAASKTWDTTKAVGKEAGEKTQEVAGKAVDVGKDVGKKVGSGAKDVASEVADKAEDAGDKIGSGAKKAGKGAKRLGQKIKDKVN